MSRSPARNLDETCLLLRSSPFFFVDKTMRCFVPREAVQLTHQSGMEEKGQRALETTAAIGKHFVSLFPRARDRGFTAWASFGALDSCGPILTGRPWAKRVASCAAPYRFEAGIPCWASCAQSHHSFLFAGPLPCPCVSSCLLLPASRTTWHTVRETNRARCNTRLIRG